MENGAAQPREGVMRQDATLLHCLAKTTQRQRQRQRSESEANKMRERCMRGEKEFSEPCGSKDWRPTFFFFWHKRLNSLASWSYFFFLTQVVKFHDVLLLENFSEIRQPNSMTSCHRIWLSSHIWNFPGSFLTFDYLDFPFPIN